MNSKSLSRRVMAMCEEIEENKEGIKPEVYLSYSYSFIHLLICTLASQFLFQHIHTAVLVQPVAICAYFGFIATAPTLSTCPRSFLASNPESD